MAWEWLKAQISKQAHLIRRTTIGLTDVDKQQAQEMLDEICRLNGLDKTLDDPIYAIIARGLNIVDPIYLLERMLETSRWVEPRMQHLFKQAGVENNPAVQKHLRYCINPLGSYGEEHIDDFLNYATDVNHMIRTIMKTKTVKAQIKQHIGPHAKPSTQAQAQQKMLRDMQDLIWLENGTSSGLSIYVTAQIIRTTILESEMTYSKRLQQRFRAKSQVRRKPLKRKRADTGDMWPVKSLETAVAPAPIADKSKDEIHALLCQALEKATEDLGLLEEKARQTQQVIDDNIASIATIQAQCAPDKDACVARWEHNMRRIKALPHAMRDDVTPAYLTRLMTKIKTTIAMPEAKEAPELEEEDALIRQLKKQAGSFPEFAGLVRNIEDANATIRLNAAHKITRHIEQANLLLNEMDDNITIAVHDINKPRQDAFAHAHYPPLSDIQKWVHKRFPDGRVVLTPSAVKSVKALKTHNEHTRIYAAIELLGEAYYAHKTASVRGQDFARAAYETFQEECQRLGLQNGACFSSAEHAGPYKKHYQFSLEGKMHEMDMHLTRGVSRDPQRILRVYYTWDSSKKRVIIGHLPTHLTTRLS